MKIIEGKVISKKMSKTATVEVQRIIAHPIYKKRIKLTKKYHVHDPFDTKLGEIVQFKSIKPISKLKKWIIIEKKKGKK